MSFTRRVACLVTLSLPLALAACNDDAPPSTRVTDTDYSDVDPATFDPPCPRTSDAPYVRSARFGGAEPTWWPREAVEGCLAIAEDHTGTVDLDGEHAILLRAIATWNEAATSCGVPLCLVDVGEVDPAQGLGYNSEGPNYNLVTYVADKATWDVRNNPSAIAATTYTQVITSGKLVDADIEVNDGGWRFSDREPVPTDAFDLEAILLHELGHVIGFDHTTDRASTMYPSENQSSATARRGLSEADVIGVCEAFACY